MTSVFISYSREDKRFRAKLEKHLASLRRNRIIDVWHDGHVVEGKWEDQISDHLNSADLILLLVTAAFLDSDACTQEMEIALQRRDRHESLVLPIILKPCDWKSSPVASLQVAPDNAKPVIEHRTQDSAFLSVADRIKQILDRGASGRRPSQFSQRSSATSVASELNDIAQCFSDAASTFQDHVETYRALLTDSAFERLQSIQQGFAQQHLTVGVFGNVKAGKSTLVNAIVGENVSPTGIGAVTTTPVSIQYGEKTGAFLRKDDATLEPLSSEGVLGWMRAQSALPAADRGEILSLTSNTVFGFRGEVSLMDTPGFGSLQEADERVSARILQGLSAALLVFRYGDSVTRPFKELLEQLRARNVMLFCICNITPDYRDAEASNPTAFGEFIASIEGKLREYGAICFRIDARAAEITSRCRDIGRRRESGLQAFDDALRIRLENRQAYSLRQCLTEIRTFMAHLGARIENEKGRLRGSMQESEHRIEAIDEEAKGLRAEIADLERTSDEKSNAWKWGSISLVGLPYGPPGWLASGMYASDQPLRP